MRNGVKNESLAETVSDMIKYTPFLTKQRKSPANVTTLR